MHGLFLSEIDPPAVGHNFWTAFKNQRLTSSGVSLCGIVQVLYYTCTNHSSILLFRRRGERTTRSIGGYGVSGVREARRRSPLELSDTLWFLFGLGATLSFRPRAGRPGADRRFVGLLATFAATLCFA